MRKVTRAVAVGVFVAALGISTATAESASAAPAANGASIVFQQNAMETHNLCASQPVVLAATGFAPGRKVVQARVSLVGSGLLFTANVPLSGGAGSLDVGTPGPGFIGTKIRVRYQVGSADRPSLRGSFSASIFDC